MRWYPFASMHQGKPRISVVFEPAGFRLVRDIEADVGYWKHKTGQHGSIIGPSRLGKARLQIFFGMGSPMRWGSTKICNPQGVIGPHFTTKLRRGRGNVGPQVRARTRVGTYLPPFSSRSNISGTLQSNLIKLCTLVEHIEGYKKM